jgi:hypothetical protein
MMKILMPSNDCLTIALDFDNARAFRLLTIINGLIKEDSFITASNDIRDQVLMEDDNPDRSNLKNTDKLNRKMVIASAISIKTEKSLCQKNYEVFHTEETNIFNALISYLKTNLTMESDYCCYP